MAVNKLSMKAGFRNFLFVYVQIFKGKILENSTSIETQILFRSCNVRKYINCNQLNQFRIAGFLLYEGKASNQEY